MSRDRYGYYRCRATQATSTSPGKCKARYIPADDFELTVWDHICGTLKSPQIAIAELKHFIKTGGEGELGSEISHLRKEIQKCKQAETNHLSLVNHDEFDPDLLKSQIAPHSAMRKRLEETLRRLELQQSQLDGAKEAERQITEYCRLMSVGLGKLNHDGKPATLSALNVRVIAIREDVSITTVVDPVVLDQKFTTIARTSALPRACTCSPPTLTQA